MWTTALPAFVSSATSSPILPLTSARFVSSSCPSSSSSLSNLSTRKTALASRSMIQTHGHTHTHTHTHTRSRLTISMNTADSSQGPSMDKNDDSDKEKDVEKDMASKDVKEEEDKLYEPDTIPTTIMTSNTENKNIGILPLFPLGLVLFPGALVPLHIFEMRYRRMFSKIREPASDADKEAENTFGLIMYDSAAKKMAQVGCAAYVTKFQPLEDGRILVVNEGRRRFKVLEIVSESPYITAKVEYFQDQILETKHEDEGKEAMQLAVQVWDSLQKVLQLSNKLWDKGMDISQSLKDQSPLVIKAESTTTEDRMRKIEKFSFGVASILDMPTLEQQTMLQTPDVRRRLGKQKKLLDAAASQLQAQYAIKSALSDK